MGKKCIRWVKDKCVEWVEEDGKLVLKLGKCPVKLRSKIIKQIADGIRVTTDE